MHPEHSFISRPGVDLDTVTPSRGRVVHRFELIGQRETMQLITRDVSKESGSRPTFVHSAETLARIAAAAKARHERKA